MSRALTGIPFIRFGESSPLDHDFRTRPLLGLSSRIEDSAITVLHYNFFSDLGRGRGPFGCSYVKDVSKGVIIIFKQLG
ncbi:hypothetical protein D3C81_719500 [compost metagenome]